MKSKLPLINSVLNPIAQTTKLCSAHTQLLIGNDSNIIRIMKDPAVYIQDRALIELLYIGGLRISEALNIKCNHITKDGRVMIIGSKGSNNKIITPMINQQYFINCSIFNISPFYGKNRFYYYRLFKEKGLYIFRKTAENNSVTHSFRYNLVSDLRNSGIDIVDIRATVGHKNIKNTLLYVNKK